MAEHTLAYRTAHVQSQASPVKGPRLEGDLKEHSPMMRPWRAAGSLNWQEMSQWFDLLFIGSERAQVTWQTEGPRFSLPEFPFKGSQAAEDVKEHPY